MPQSQPELSALPPSVPPHPWWARARSALASHTVLRTIVHGFVTVAGLTLLAKGVSFLKDAGVAHRYGINDDLDAFNVAFTILNFVAMLLGGGLPASIVPSYAKLMESRSTWRAERFAIQSSAIHFASLLIILVPFWFAGETLIDLLYHGFPPEKRALTLSLLHQLSPFLLCYGLTLHLSNWLRGKMEFAAAALAPVFTPALILIVIYSTHRETSVESLVLGTNIGSFVTVAVLAWHLRRRFPKRQLWWRNLCRFWEPELRTAIIGASPFIISGIMMGSAPLIDQSMATPLESGSVSALSYSDKVCSIILALTASAAADTLFPFFSQLVAREDWHGLRRRLVHSTLTVLGIATPFVLLLLWQAPLIVKLLFERGEFHAHDTQHVAHVLRFAALQIPFYIASMLMSRVVVSLRANSFTLIVTALALFNNIVFNKLLMVRYGAAGIALSTGIVYLVSCAVLFIFLQRRITTLITSKEAST